MVNWNANLPTGPAVDCYGGRSTDEEFAQRSDPAMVHAVWCTRNPVLDMPIKVLAWKALPTTFAGKRRHENLKADDVLRAISPSPSPISKAPPCRFIPKSDVRFAASEIPGSPYTQKGLVPPPPSLVSKIQGRIYFRGRGTLDDSI
ncbi:hypothetical protein E4U33_000963 [Claviceps sp. LM78 group G4]|nr:hypothetical protein E4U33_000963 [Claviceps sp. LM78 group G4]